MSQISPAVLATIATPSVPGPSDRPVLRLLPSNPPDYLSQKVQFELGILKSNLDKHFLLLGNALLEDGGTHARVQEIVDT
ncbi:hypothetical protein M231_08035, partial [Tremella mesenterica]